MARRSRFTARSARAPGSSCSGLPAPPRRSALSRNARCLVVDDHLEMARLLADQLGDAGYTVDIAGGGQEAIAAVQKGPYDVVVTDLKMKDADGLDVLAATHRIDPGLPVLIMTAFGGIDSAIEAIQ